MRRLPDILFCFLFGVSFLTATTGFSVHHCLIEDSYHVMLIASDPSCHAIHEQDGHSDKGSSKVKHDLNCCSTQVFSLDEPTLVSNGIDITELVRELVSMEFIPALAMCPGMGTTEIPSIRHLHPLPPERSVYPGNHLVPLRL